MIHKIENEAIAVEVSSAGAELKSIYNKTTKTEYLWQGDPQSWQRRAPVLFPVVGKLTNNSYKAEGKTYTMGQHGFARDQEFSLKENTNDKLVFEISANDTTREVYPYNFSLQIIYTLVGKKVEVAYKISNTDNKEIHFSIGGHPGFNCPLSTGENFSDYYIEFEKKEQASTWLIDGGLISKNTHAVLNGEKELALTEELFSRDALVFKHLESSWLILKSRNSNHSLKFHFGEFPFLGIWKKPGASFVCIEPWQGIADSVGFTGELKDKEGMVALAKGNSFEKKFFVEVN